MDSIIDVGILVILVSINITMFYIIAGVRAGAEQRLKFFKQNSEWFGDALDILHIMKKTFSIKMSEEEKDEKFKNDHQMMAEHLKEYEKLEKEQSTKNSRKKK